MAFIRATGKHRAPSRTRRRVSSGAAGIAGIAAVGVVGAVASPALADAGSPSPDDTGLTRAIDLDGSVADTVAHQADAQQTAAEKAEVEAAAKKAAAEAKEKAKEAKKKAEEAKRKAAAEKAKKEREERERSARAAESKRAQLSGYMAPVANPQLSTPYQSSSGLWSSGSHTGVDFHADMGTKVNAVAAGEVVEAGDGGAYGNNIVIKHKDGHYSQYGHLSSIGVSVGQTVSAGQQIALSGNTGNTTGPHLHFEIRTGPDYGSDIDPVAYMRSKGVSL
ncbi:M23 family metallopeptidase [Streptomyces sp. ODS28]|uniref:M23 family metallopeptidase n=1 Tax=Streptomyces sp. ODS28 TaxID=3136688 RepID=UPI0031EBC283